MTKNMTVKMNKIEKLLYFLVSLMITAILYLTFAGYQRGAYEQNPVARFLFETIYQYTGSWELAILSFIPIAIVGIYIAVFFIKRDHQEKNSRAGQIFLTAFILLLLPNTISIVMHLMWDNSFVAPAGIALATVYLVYELLKHKIIEKTKTR